MVTFIVGQRGPRILKINSWNEWTEGRYIEPGAFHCMNPSKQFATVLARPDGLERECRVSDMLTFARREFGRSLSRRGESFKWRLR